MRRLAGHSFPRTFHPVDLRVSGNCPQLPTHTWLLACLLCLCCSVSLSSGPNFSVTSRRFSSFEMPPKRSSSSEAKPAHRVAAAAAVAASAAAGATTPMPRVGPGSKRTNDEEKDEHDSTAGVAEPTGRVATKSKRPVGKKSKKVVAPAVGTIESSSMIDDPAVLDDWLHPLRHCCGDHRQRKWRFRTHAVSAMCVERANDRITSSALSQLIFSNVLWRSLRGGCARERLVQRAIGRGGLPSWTVETSSAQLKKKGKRVCHSRVATVATAEGRRRQSSIGGAQGGDEGRICNATQRRPDSVCGCMRLLRCEGGHPLLCVHPLHRRLLLTCML